MPGDGCATAQSLNFTDFVAIATGELTTATNSGDGPYPNSGNDRVWYFDLAQEQTVRVTMTAQAPPRPTAYLRRTCGATVGFTTNRLRPGRY